MSRTTFYVILFVGGILALFLPKPPGMSGAARVWGRAAAVVLIGASALAFSIGGFIGDLAADGGVILAIVLLLLMIFELRAQRR
jgi:hypothetical protein